MEAEIYIIPQFSNFVKSFLKNFSKNIFPKSIDKRAGMCYNKKVATKIRPHFPDEKFFRKFSKTY